MCVFIPDTIAEGASQAEKYIFEQFKRFPDSYTVMHSLRLARHRNKILSEIDFVVVSEYGILCLEVKGGGIGREFGQWYSVDHQNRKHMIQNPFNQSESAMHSLHDHLKKRLGSHPLLSKVLFGWGVMFPDVHFNDRGPEVIPEIVYDLRDDQKLDAYIKRVYDYWRKVLKEKHGIEKERLTPSECRKLVHLLRGDFGYIPSLGMMLNRTEQKLIKLTEEQFDRLSMASENPRILLKGGAGTGKTVICYEIARREALLGKRVLFTCFTSNLAQYLRTNNDMENLNIVHFHKFLADSIRNQGLDLPKSDDQNRLFTELYPEAFYEMVESIGGPKYDLLVIDEGQDLIRYEYLMCMDLVLEGGLKKGRWFIAYDPNQNIYNSEFEKGMSFLDSGEFSFVRLSLDTNCRNTRSIGCYTTALTGIQPERHYRVDGPAVTRSSYRDFRDQRKKLIDKIDELVCNGVELKDIYLLSPNSFEKSCLDGQEKLGKYTVQNVTKLTAGEYDLNRIKFCTVQGFKGLEAKVVLYLDVNGFLSRSHRLQNYIAMSRAKTYLHIFYNEKAEEELKKIFDESISLLELISDELVE